MKPWPNEYYPNYFFAIERRGSIEIAPEAQKDLPKQSNHWAAKRKEEFLCARSLLRNSLETFLDQPFVGDLKNKPDRQITWPDNVLGSISHCREWVMVALAKTGQCKGIGVDVEPLIELSRLKPGLIKKIARPQEINRSELSDQEFYTLIFSAKEAIFKAIYPFTLEYFGFQRAEILELDTLNSFFRFKLFGFEMIDLKEVCGHYRKTDSHIFTIVSVQ